MRVGGVPTKQKMTGGVLLLSEASYHLGQPFSLLIHKRRRNPQGPQSKTNCPTYSIPPLPLSLLLLILCVLFCFAFSPTLFGCVGFHRFAHFFFIFLFYERPCHPSKKNSGKKKFSPKLVFSSPHHTSFRYHFFTNRPRQTTLLPTPLMHPPRI